MMADELKWKTLGTTTIIKDQWIDLEASRCQLPNGTIIEPFYVNHVPDFAVIVAVTEEGQLLAERQYRHGVGEVLLELPAGSMEAGESGEEAARRELREETGYLAGDLEFLFKIAPNASSTSNYAWCYLARGVKPWGPQKLDATEDLEVLTIPVAELRKMLGNGAFQQAVHVAALYRALEILEQK